MDRIFLIIMSASIVLLTTVIGLASPQADGIHLRGEVPLLLRTIPRADVTKNQAGGRPVWRRHREPSTVRGPEATPAQLVDRQWN
jgi:hypothetical protein